MQRNATSGLELSSCGIKSAAYEACQSVGRSFEQCRLPAGIAAPGGLMDGDAKALAGEAHQRGAGKPGCRRGRIVGFHGGKVDVERPRARPDATFF